MRVWEKERHMKSEISATWYNERAESHQYHQSLHEALQCNQTQGQLQKHQAQH